MNEPGTFLTAEWRRLVMLNYEVDSCLVLPHLPLRLKLDRWQGRTLVSLVGFMFLKTRVLGVPIPFHRNFEEVNLRFYVRAPGPEGWRRGVVFIKEAVPRAAIALTARWVYGEPYVAVPMSHAFGFDEGGGLRRAEYGWRSGGRDFRLAAEVEGEPVPLVPGSEEEFIAEHYWGYTGRSGGACFEYRVEHPPWRVWRAGRAVFEGDATAFYGPAFGKALAGPPVSAFVAEGSAVKVMRGRRIA